MRAPVVPGAPRPHCPGLGRAESLPTASKALVGRAQRLAHDPGRTGGWQGQLTCGSLSAEAKIAAPKPNRGGRDLPGRLTLSQVPLSSPGLKLLSDVGTALTSPCAQHRSQPACTCTPRALASPPRPSLPPPPAFRLGRMYLYVCTCMHACVHVSVHVRACMHASIRVCTSARVCMCVRACVSPPRPSRLSVQRHPPGAARPSSHGPQRHLVECRQWAVQTWPDGGRGATPGPSPWACDILGIPEGGTEAGRRAAWVGV